MPIRCRSIAGQKVVLGPGEPIIAGCELIDGSGIFDNKEEFPMRFCEIDGVAGDDGAVVIWPDTGNDLLKYGEGEDVPVGTVLHVGCVIENGEIKCAPYTTQAPSTAVSEDGSEITGEDVDEGEEKGFCVGSGNVNLPDDEDFLSQLANFEIPDLQAFALSGFTAKIQELMGKLNQILGKLNAEVDKIMSQAVIDPEDVCTPPVKAAIRNMLKIMAAIMKVMPVLQKIIQVIKIIRKVIKLVRKILKWTPPFVVPIIEGLMKVLNIMGLVDMCVSTLLKTVGRFTSLVPILQAQLMSILAQCAGQENLKSKEECEAAGGTWIDPQDLKDLQDMYDKISNETENLNTDESIGFCSITEHLTKEACEAAGGTWTDLDVDTDFGEVDTSALSKELAKQMEELDRCFADEELNSYLRGF